MAQDDMNDGATQHARQDEADVAALAKVTPLKWLLAPLSLFSFLFSLVLILPGLIFHFLRMQDEQGNYRDANGFRPTLNRWLHNHSLLLVAPSLVILMALVPAVSHLLGQRGFFLVLGLLMIVTTGFTVRKLQIDHSRPQVSNLINCLVSSGVFMGIALQRMPISAIAPAVFLSSFLSFLWSGSRAPRMDWSLFLRAKNHASRWDGMAGPRRAAELEMRRVWRHLATVLAPP
jgi:hypothetical protein